MILILGLVLVAAVAVQAQQMAQPAKIESPRRVDAS